jgi:hypothetical protein
MKIGDNMSLNPGGKNQIYACPITKMPEQQADGSVSVLERTKCTETGSLWSKLITNHIGTTSTYIRVITFDLTQITTKFTRLHHFQGGLIALLIG